MDALGPRRSGYRALSVAGFVYDTGRFSEEGSPGRELSSNFLYVICFLLNPRSASFSRRLHWGDISLMELNCY